MRRRIPPILVVAFAALWSIGAGSAPVSRAGAISSHVVVISIDGLRPDAIAKYDARTLLRLQREGAYASTATTVFPSKTLPSHTSMITGVTPEIHGITWNSDKTGEFGYVEAATIFEIAKQHGFTAAGFFSKSKFHQLIQPGTLDYAQAPNGANWLATRTVADVRQYLRYERPNLLFVHIGEPDYAGHTIGWMSFAYGWAVKRADAAVRAVLEAADRAYGEGNYTVILTADHGGHGRDHGTDDLRDMSIPWIVWGRGVANQTITAPVNTTDTAATVLYLLGIATPESWTGSAVATAFTATARLAAENAIAAPAASN
ncbi:MAG: alkaline phosphatase family protein [Gemmatimonadota bacterium]